VTFSWHFCLPSIHPVSDLPTGYVWGGQVSHLSSATISRLVLRSRTDLGLLSDWGWSGKVMTHCVTVPSTLIGWCNTP